MSEIRNQKSDQDKTIEELKKNLVDAIQLIFATNREELSAEYRQKEVVKERIII